MSMVDPNPASIQIVVPSSSSFLNLQETSKWSVAKLSWSTTFSSNGSELATT